jgi:hypothetical protein
MIEKLKVKKAQVGPFQKSKSQFCSANAIVTWLSQAGVETRAATHNPRSHLGMLRSCSAFSRALGRSAYSTRVPLRNLHTRVPQVPFFLSHWSEPTGDGLVPIVVEQTVRACARACCLCTSHHTAGLIFPTLTFCAPSQGRGERSYDIFSRLLRERVIMLYGPVRTPCAYPSLSAKP